MKINDKKKPINTVPKGVWESSRPTSNKGKSTRATETTDLQGNGYPKSKANRLCCTY